MIYRRDLIAAILALLCVFAGYGAGDDGGEISATIAYQYNLISLRQCLQHFIFYRFGADVVPGA